MLELLRTNDIVLLSLVEAVLADADIGFHIADQFMSVMEGSTGFVQRRVLVSATHMHRARSALIDAGLEQELSVG